MAVNDTPGQNQVKSSSRPSPSGEQSHRRGRNDASLANVMTEIQESGLVAEDTSAEDIVQTVMCRFLSRLSGGESQNVYARLPNSFKGILEECALHEEHPPQLFDKDEFVALLSRELDLTLERTESVIRMVFTNIQRYLPKDEVYDVASQLPLDLREMWESP